MPESKIVPVEVAGQTIAPATVYAAVNGPNGRRLDRELDTLSDKKAEKSRTEYHTLTVDGWTEQADGTFTQVINLKSAVIGDPPIDIGEVTIGITPELLAAIEAAKIIPTAVSDTVITVTAFGTKPEVDIPIFVTVGS